MRVGQVVVRAEQRFVGGGQLRHVRAHLLMVLGEQARGLPPRGGIFLLPCVLRGQVSHLLSQARGRDIFCFGPTGTIAPMSSSGVTIFGISMHPKTARNLSEYTTRRTSAVNPSPGLKTGGSNTTTAHARSFVVTYRRRAGTCGPPCTAATARPRPLAALGRIAEYYAVTLRSDRGYVGVLAYNPVHGDYNTVCPRAEPYDLAELARALPAHWRRPSKPADLATAPGRNCALFAALCKLALGGSDEGLLTWARTLNSEFAVPLPESEVLGIWRSVCRYRARWHAEGHQQGWLWKQARTGQAGRAGGGCEASGRDSPCA